MPTDPDQIRVDLLRIKRKLYISYPEGSKERREFMLASKMSELSYLQRLVTPDMVDIVFEEYSKALKTECYHMSMALGFGGSLSIMLLGFHQLYKTAFLNFWFLPLVIGFCIAGQHLYHVVLNWRRFQPFKKDYDILHGKIMKLLNEIKGLTHE